MVEFDKGLTLLSAPHWQLDNYCLLSSCFVTSISLLFKFTIQPLSHTRSLTLFALSCHSLHLCCCSFTSNFSPSFYETFSFFSTTLPYLVVLLDTTTVLGELDWKTYPVNGVSDPGISWIKAINCLRFYWSKKTSDTPPPPPFFFYMVDQWWLQFEPLLSKIENLSHSRLDFLAFESNEDRRQVLVSY